MEYIHRFFRFTWRVQFGLLATRAKYSKLRKYEHWIMIGTDVAIVILILVSTITIATFNIAAVIVTALLIGQILLSLFFSKSNILFSVGDFLKGAGFLSLCFIGFWGIIASRMTSVSAQNYFGILALLAFLLTWLLLSVIANSKVSTTVNCFVAGILAIILALLDTVVVALPQNFAFSNMTAEYLSHVADSGYTVVQLLQILIRIAFLPLIITSGLGVILAQMKTYWIDKYNDSKDYELKE